MLHENEKLIKQFEHICEWVSSLSSVYVVNGERKDAVYQVANECIRILRDVVAQEATQFMVAPLLEHYFDIIRPAIVIPFNELATGNSEKLQECQAFVQALQSHPVKELWAQRAEQFKVTAESIGYTFNKTDYQDIASIAPILVNAFTALNTWACSRVYTIHTGKRSGVEPKILNDIAIFDSVFSASAALMKIAEPAFMGFGGVRPTMKQTECQFDTWACGVNTRKNNMMMHSHITESEYEQSFDDYRTKLYVVVRDGENLWFFETPSHLGQGETIVGKDGFLNYYKKRITYAPIQIFFKNPPVTGESTALTLYNPHCWSLKDILDEEQKIWLPVFLQTVKNKFFIEQCEDKTGLCAESTAIQIALPDGTIQSNYPVIAQHVVQVPEPDELFTQDIAYDEHGSPTKYTDYVDLYREMPALLKWLGITSKDIADIPFGWTGLVFETESKEIIKTQAIRAYYKIAKERINNMRDEKLNAQQWLHSYLHNNMEAIFERIAHGELPNAVICVDKEPLIHYDGVRNPDVCARTDIDDSKYSRHEFKNYREWLPVTLMDKKPPVQVKLELKSVSDIAALCQCTVEELPDNVRHLGRYVLPQRCVWNMSKSVYKQFFH